MPASTALPGSLALQRAMRSLKVRAADARSRTLDETATAQASAACDALIPVLRPGTERRFSLALVVDTGPAMAIWARLEAELLLALQRLGAFRDLRRWYLRTDGGVLHGVSESAHPHTPVRDPAELLDPAGRRLILVLTDGAGSAWYSGAMARTLRTWAAQSPVAILQPLPQQLWPYTALRPVRGRLLSPRAATPNARLRFIPRGRSPKVTAPPVPVPVLELAPRGLAGWSELVARESPATMDCAVTLADPAAVASPVTARTEAPVTAEERVRRFAEQASPQAQRLASYLAAAPLSLPVIRHVQQAMLPGSGPSPLAEVLLGGLVNTRGVFGEISGWRYEFAPGVRDYLLRGLERTDALRVLATVSRELNARIGRGADEFTAIVPLPGTRGRISAASRPFAQLSARVLERVTGEFTPADRPAGLAAPGESAQTLIRRYQRTGSLTDIDAAITALRRSSEHAERGGLPAADDTADLELATALRLRYLALADPADLDEAITLASGVIRRAPPGSIPPAAAAELATTLGLRNARTGSAADLDEAIVAAGSALNAVSSGDAGIPGYASALGELLTRRGTPADLDNAVYWLRSAAENPALDDAERPVPLTRLATALRARAHHRDGMSAGMGTRRYGRGGRLDLDDAITALQRAIQLAGAGEDLAYRPQAARYAALGAVLLDRGQVTASAAGLAEAARAYRQAADLVPSDAETGAYLAGLGVALREQANASHDGKTLGEAVTALRRSLGETLPDAPELPQRQIELATTLLARYLAEGHRADLVEARYRADQAVASATSDSDTLAARLLHKRTIDLEANPRR